MNETAFLAFVATPALVVVLGYVAVRLQERETARVRRSWPDCRRSLPSSGIIARAACGD